MKKKTVSDIILQETTECDQDFLCQKPGWKPCGQPKREIKHKLLAQDIDNFRRRICNYNVSFGGQNYCLCPTRIEIYNRYNK